jgi:hypothetical protein
MNIMKRFGVILFGLIVSFGIGYATDNTTDDELVNGTCVTIDGITYRFSLNAYNKKLEPVIDYIDKSVVERAVANGDTLKLPDSITYNDVEYDVKGIAFLTGGPTMTGIKKLILPKKLQSLWGFRVMSSDLETVEFGDSLLYISLSLMECPSIESVNLPAGLCSVVDGSFYGSGLKTLSLPDKTTTLGIGAFYESKQLEELDLNNVRTIFALSFSKCRALKRVVIPPTVRYIGFESFKEMESLEEIVFKDSQIELRIGPCVFSQCPNLKRIYMERSVPPSAYDLYSCSDYDPGYNRITEENSPEIVFGQISSECRHCSEPLDPTKVKLYVPIGTAEAYRNSVTWGAFTDIEEYDVSGMAETELRPDWKLYDNLNIKAGAIELTNLNGNAVSVYGIDGRLINSGVATGTWTVAVPQGVYLVKVDSTTAKVMVK